MEGTYDVMLGKEKRGSVTVRVQGLYWHIICQCKLYADVMQELVAMTGDREVKLGLLVPESGSYCLRTRIVKKELPSFDGFCIRPRHRAEEFHPIQPEEPFRYLHRLEDAFLTRRGEQIGLVLRQKK